MPDAFQHLFGAVCGQNPDHSWTPGGIPLPLCQRCTGIYVGAFAALLLQIWLKPEATPRFLKLHGAFLLLMIPSGLYWFPQGPVLRSVSGVLFGFGVVAFLILPLSGGGQRPGGEKYRYPAGILAAAVLVPLLGSYGGEAGAMLLTLLAALGLPSLAFVVLANLGLIPLTLLHRSQNLETDTPSPTPPS